MELTEQEIAERFGVELDDAEKPEQEQETSGQESADTAQAVEEESGDGGNAEEAGEAASDAEEKAAEEKTEQSAEQRHAQAKARKEREAQERREELRRAIQEARDEVYREQFAGQSNPFTGKAITNEAEYKAFMQAKRAQSDKAAQENVSRQLKNAGIDASAIEQMVKSQTQPLAQQVQEMRMQAAREQARAVMQKAGEQIASQIKVINAKYGESFNNVDDIIKGGNGEEFNRFVRMGATLEQAYYLANQKQIEAKSAKAAFTAGRNAQAGKAHMNPLGNGGKDARVEVPREVIEIYQAMMPSATMEEIRAAYAEEINKN